MAANTHGRLIRLEERAPRGCPTCRTWGPSVYQVGDAPPDRGEACPACGRRVPILLTRRIVVVGPDDAPGVA